jgi:dolichyl-phosphate-mannose--protein O-mannosyl transferase
VLAGLWAVVRDREYVRRRLTAEKSLGFRSWLIVATIFLSLALATKWSAAYFIVACSLLVVFFTARTRISLGHEKPWKTAILRDTLPWLPVIVVIIIGIYLASWSGWMLSDTAYMRTWAHDNPDAGISWLPEVLRSLIQYHTGAWNFHVGLTTAHSYSANPWTWPLQLRPTSFYYDTFTRGESGCEATSCSAEVIALGNPLIWWAGTLAILHHIWRAVTRRETRAVAIVAMFMAGWAPWLLYQQRTIFSFYSIVMIPFICMALAGTLGIILGDAHAGARVRPKRALIVGGFVLITVLLSWWMMPIWTGEVVSYDHWRIHMWFPSWI